MDTRPTSRLWASSLCALALLLAACGGQSDTELATIDDGAETPAVVEDLGGPDEPAATTLETVDAVEDGEDDALPVPEAPVPEAPSIASSPAARQQNQAAGIPAIDGETGRYERLPTPAEDLDDASYLAQSAPAADAPEAPAAPQGGQFTIPVAGDVDFSADGANAPAQAGVSQNAPSPFFDASASDASRVGLIEPAQLDASLEQGASGVLPDPEPQASSLEPDDTAAAPAVDAGVDPSTQLDPALDGAINDLSAPGGSVAGSGGTGQSGSVDEANCELRPWARGCPIPDDIFDRVDDDGTSPDGSDEDGTAEGGPEDGGPEESGVDVPQSVIDILLTDPDVEPVPAGDDPGSSDPVDPGDSDVPAVVNPAGG